LRQPINPMKVAAATIVLIKARAGMATRCSNLGTVQNLQDNSGGPYPHLRVA
jgi:hypothetical protein